MGVVKIEYDANPFYVYFKKHVCPHCYTRLKVNHISNLSRKKSYNLRDSIVGGAYFPGEVEYKKGVFYCPNCKIEIPFAKQRALEKRIE